MVQNSAARFFTGTKKRVHITPVLASLHWLPIKLRVDFKVLLFAYKALHNSGPDYIRDLIKPYTASRSLRSSDQLLLSVPVHMDFLFVTEIWLKNGEISSLGELSPSDIPLAVLFTALLDQVDMVVA